MALKRRKLRLLFFGGTETLERILPVLDRDGHHTLLGVVLREDAGPRLVRLIGKLGIPVVEGDFRTSAVKDRLARLRADLFVSVLFRGIFPPELIRLPRLGIINVHGALCPEQRGPGGVFGAFINGEDAGCTVHWIDEGIDTGDIILRKRLPISERMTMGDYLAQAHKLQAKALLEAIHLIATGTGSRTSQAGQPYGYFPRKSEGEEFIDWNEPTWLIHAKIRARRPGPLNFTIAHGNHDGEKLFVLDSRVDRLVRIYRSCPGVVLERHFRKGILVKTLDTALWISRCTMDPTPGFSTEPPYRFLGQSFIPRFPPGSRLGYHLPLEIDRLKRQVDQLMAEIDRLKTDT